MRYVSPGTVLLLVLALIGAQITRVLAPHRSPYVVTLVLAIAGVVGGEAVAYAIHAGGPGLGVLHPVADLVGVAAAEAAGVLLWPAAA